jgi:hypothetical protein
MSCLVVLAIIALVALGVLAATSGLLKLSGG